jgi:hypothetical protein
VRSLRAQIIAFTAFILLFTGVAMVADVTFTRRTDAISSQASTLGDAMEGHIMATFLNEEARAITHSVHALYDFSSEEMKIVDQKIKSYSVGARVAVADYGKRSRAEVEKNLERPLPDAIKAMMREHLATLTTYHAALDKAFAAPAKTKAEVVESFATLNAIRSKIGDFRKKIGEAIAAERIDVIAQRQLAERHQQNINVSIFAVIIALVVGFAALVVVQLNASPAAWPTLWTPSRTTSRYGRRRRPFA